MSSDTNDRYEAIMRRMAERRAEQAAAPKREIQEQFAHILDAVDAWGKLEKLKSSRALRPFCWGPKDVRGLSPSPWVGVIIWRRGSGYHGYRQLQIAGVWVYGDEDRPLIAVGTKLVPYSAPTYEAEAYHKLMRRTFDLYYKDNGSPPGASTRLFTTSYDPEQRLAIRDDVRAHLVAWAAHG